MKKSLICLSIFMSISRVDARPLDIEIHAESAILINGENGRILFEKNSQKKQFPASTTKVATALYALTIKGDQLNETVSAESEAIASVTEAMIRRSNYKLPSHYVEQGSCHMGIKKGEQFKFNDLIYGMMLPSANDAANVIAQCVGDSIPLFVEEMNRYLKSIGCKNTHFCNPHGLHHPDHETTAEDMALIAREAMKIPFFREVVKTVRYTRPKTNMQESTTLLQLNKLLRNGKYYYKKATGIKTGSTSIAQNNLVAAAEDQNRKLIYVSFKTKDRNDLFNDAIIAFEKAFNESKVERHLIKTGKQKFVYIHDSASKPIDTYTTKSVTIAYYPSEEPEIKSFLKWEELKFPVIKGQKVGEVIIQNLSDDTREIVDLFALEDVESTWGSWFKNLF